MGRPRWSGRTTGPRSGEFDPLHLDVSLAERQGDPAGADGELERRTPLGQGREQIEHGLQHREIELRRIRLVVDLCDLAIPDAAARARARGCRSTNDVLGCLVVKYAQYIDQIVRVLLYQAFGAWSNIPLVILLLSALLRMPR